MGAHRKLNFVYRNSFYQGNAPHKQVNTGTIYVVFASLIFPGKDAVGDINYLKGIIGRSSTANPMDIRIVDVTNGGAVIAELTNQTPATTGTIVDFGTPANVPDGEALWSIEMRRSSGGTGNPRLMFLGIAGQ